MSADRFYDAEDAEASPAREPRRLPRPEHGTETRARHELAAENAGLGRAVGELAAENAELYKRISVLEGKLRNEQDRFRAWAREVSNHEDERAARDEARAKREENLADRLAELERRLDGEAAHGPGEAEQRIEDRDPARAEAGRRGHGRASPSNEVIAIGVAWAAVAASALGQVKGMPEIATVASYAAEGAAVAASHVALYRKRKEAGSGDRPQN
jgi:hypothetical protein